MKIYFSLNYVLFMSLFYFCCSPAVRYDKTSVVGCWQKTMNQEQFIFTFEKFAGGEYQGSITTYHNDKQVEKLPLSEISFKNLKLRMITNSQKNISFEGILDTAAQIVRGNLHTRNGSLIAFDLVRYTGSKCMVEKSEIRPPELSYRNVDQLPETGMTPDREKTSRNINSGTNHKNSVSEKDALAVINRWHGDIYPSYLLRSSALLSAFLLDPVTDEIAGIWKDLIKNIATTEAKVAAINQWANQNLGYTQVHAEFSALPGKDPWGTFVNSQQPVFKKLIPPEMRAMQVRTGKISGKCFTLVNLIISNFMKLGVNPDDIIVLIVKSGNARHAMALVKYEGEVLLVNLNMVGQLKKLLQKDFKPYEILGVYSLYFAQVVDLKISSKELKEILKVQNSSLSDAFFNYYNIQPVPRPGSMPTGKDISNLLKEGTPASHLSELTRYAYQHLRVPHPEYYLQASMLSSLPKNVSHSLPDQDDVFTWINSHIRYGSIFEDPEIRLMTADQVLVFQQGSYKDQAVLAYALLRHIGVHSEIVITENNAYVKLANNIYDLKNKNYCDEFESKPILMIK
jgi:hypothetical protein